MSAFNPIVTIPSQIIFREPVRRHPKNVTKSKMPISDLAFHLERVYKIISIFAKIYKSEIKSILLEEVKEAWKYGRDQAETNDVIAERILDLWHKYIINEEHGIKTKAARKAARQSFVDTGAYYKSMLIKIGMGEGRELGPGTLGQYLIGRGKIR